MKSLRWLWPPIVVAVAAVVVFVVVQFGLLRWLPQDAGTSRNVMEGLSWLAAVVTVAAPAMLVVSRWIRRSGNGIQSSSLENPLVGRALHLVDGSLPQVSAVGLLQLRVKPAIDTYADDGTDLPPYVPRDVDEDLEWAIHQGGMVLLHGPAAVGKSRAAAEALRRLRPEHRLLVPRDGSALREIVEGGVELRDVVVWLDDLERYLGVSGLDLGLLQRVCPSGSSEVAVLATMRDEELARHTHAANASAGERIAGIDQAAIDLLTQLHGRRRISVPSTLSENELDNANKIGERDARVRRAILAKEGFAEYLAAGTAMVDRWSVGDGPEFVIGQALISAAVDCRRAGYHKPVPAKLLKRLHRNFLSPAWRSRADLPTVDIGLRWATQRVLGASSCLVPTDDRHYIASDYLVDRTQHGTTPLIGPVFDTTWTALIASLTPIDNLAVATAAYHAHRLDIAEQGLTPAVAENHPLALVNLGVLLTEQSGREDEAEEAYRRAAAAGETRALVNVANLWASQVGREDEAEQLLRQLAADGVSGALLSLGNLLAEQAGREGLAEEAYRQALAIEEWTPDALGNLGLLLAKQFGREVEAEKVLRRAAEAGQTMALTNLGVVLARQSGREAEAENAFKRAIDAGEPSALANLALLLAKQSGRESEAEQLLWKVVASGETAALVNLGVVLAREGREVEAEEIYRRALDSGHVDAWFNLGLLLVGQEGRQGEAENAYRESAQLGYTDASLNLGILLAGQEGREEEAEIYLREAAEAGEIRALANLGVVLAMQHGREEEAEHLLMQAAEGGMTAALANLSFLLSRQEGREAEALALLRRAAAADPRIQDVIKTLRDGPR